MYNRFMKLSIIIPIYNSEKYLARCLGSVLDAIGKYGEAAEIILVENNSTDKSWEIIKQYCKKYPQVMRAEKCATQGAAAARNYGVKKARGEYLWFVDADDTVHHDAVSKLLKIATETKADLVMTGMRRVYPDGHTDYLSAVRTEEKNYKSRFVRYGLGPMQLLIRRAWWKANSFKFTEGRIHEDMELMSALILYTDNYAYVDEPLYNYYQNPDSVLHKRKWDAHYLDIFPALEGLYARFEAAKATETYRAELEWFFIWNLLIDSAKDFEKFKDGHAGFRKTREMLKKYFPKWRKNRFLRAKPLKLRLKVWLNYYRNR